MAALAEETLQTDEERTVAEFVSFLKEASTRRYPTGPLPRFNQGRAAGCVAAEFEVLGTLAPELRVGVFAEPRTYRAWIRFANASSTSDRERDVRGMSVKLFDVSGENLTAGVNTQDFILNSHPVMVAPDTREFLQLLKAMEAGGFQQARYFLTHPKAAVIGFRARQNPSCHLDIRYWSTTPYLFGPGRAVKYHVRPASASATQRPPALSDTYLTDALRSRLAHSEATFDFLVQFQKDARTTPIEDASVEWRERESPYIPVARIRIPPQQVDAAETRHRCETVSFNPWHALPAHRPLGNMNRARREIYRRMAALRAVREPAPV